MWAVSSMAISLPLHLDPRCDGTLWTAPLCSHFLPQDQSNVPLQSGASAAVLLWTWSPVLQCRMDTAVPVSPTVTEHWMFRFPQPVCVMMCYAYWSCTDAKIPPTHGDRLIERLFNNVFHLNSYVALNETVTIVNGEMVKTWKQALSQHSPGMTEENIT